MTMTIVRPVNAVSPTRSHRCQPRGAHRRRRRSGAADGLRAVFTPGVRPCPTRHRVDSARRGDHPGGVRLPVAEPRSVRRRTRHVAGIPRRTCPSPIGRRGPAQHSSHRTRGSCRHRRDASSRCSTSATASSDRRQPNGSAPQCRRCRISNARPCCWPTSVGARSGRLPSDSASPKAPPSRDLRLGLSKLAGLLEGLT